MKEIAFVRVLSMGTLTNRGVVLAGRLIGSPHTGSRSPSVSGAREPFASAQTRLAATGAFGHPSCFCALSGPGRGAAQIMGKEVGR